MNRFIKYMIFVAFVVAGFSCTNDKQQCPASLPEYKCPDLSHSQSHDTYVLMCYRCGLGQEVAGANKDSCLKEYRMYNVGDRMTKQRCK